jgi:hypothetical protein
MSEVESTIMRVDSLVAEAERARGHGNWREAADRYLQAARLVDRTQAEPLEADALQLRAADCLIHTGALGSAWRILRTLLEQCDVQPPSSPAKALIGTTWRRGRFMLRRSDIDAEHPPTTKPADRRRRAVLEGAAESLGLVQTALADSLRTHHLAEVARAGDSSSRCRALASEVAMQTRIGSPFDKSVKRLLERCGDLAAQSGRRSDQASRQLAIATHEFSHGRWRGCVEACERANAIFLELADEDVSVAHERVRVSALHWFALAWLGELEALRVHLDRAIAQAEADKDSLLLLEALTGQPMLAWLAADEVDGVRERAAMLLRHHRAVPNAPWPESGYRRQHYRELMAEVHAGLYRGDPLPAWAALTSQWRELESAFYLPMRTIGLEIRSARARVGLALVERFVQDPALEAARMQAQTGLGGWDHGRLVADVKSQLEVIAREHNCVAPSLGHLLQAGLANLEGQGEDAQIQLDAAVRGFNSVDMALHRECARYALGELIGGVEGGQMQDLAEAWMRGAGVVAPRRMAASQAPGFGLG